MFYKVESWALACSRSSSTFRRAEGAWSADVIVCGRHCGLHRRVTQVMRLPDSSVNSTFTLTGMIIGQYLCTSASGIHAPSKRRIGSAELLWSSEVKYLVLLPHLQHSFATHAQNIRQRRAVQLYRLWPDLSSPPMTPRLGKSIVNTYVLPQNTGKRCKAYNRPKIEAIC